MSYVSGVSIPVEIEHSMSTRAASAWGSLLLLHEIFSAAVIEECPVVEFKISRLLWVFLIKCLACAVEDVNYLFTFTVPMTSSRC